MEFNKKKQDAAIAAIEDMCYHCEKHTDACPLAVAAGELRQDYTKSNRPNVNYKDFTFDAKKINKAISKIEEMCLHCKEHTDDCPIVKAVQILEHYKK